MEAPKKTRGRRKKIVETAPPEIDTGAEGELGMTDEHEHE
jgi:hypothetical protein